MRWYASLTKPEKVLLWFTAVAVFFGLLVRIWNITFPEKQVFDEVYFPVMATQYLGGVDVFDVHPPLGKLIIAGGIWLFGDTFFGWRIMPLIAGCLLIFGMSLMYWRLFNDRIGAWMMAIIIALEGILIVYSRVGLMDGVLFLATFLAFYLGTRVRDGRSMALFGIALGLAVSIKWPAAAVLPAVFWFTIRDKQYLRILGSLGISLVVYVLVVAFGEWLDGARGISSIYAAVVEWHSQTASYHAHLTATHPWSSPWYTWPVMDRPVLLIYDTLQSGSARIMTTIGNPLWWWASSALTLGSVLWIFWDSMLVKGKLLKPREYLRAVWNHELTPYLIGYFAAWLPWAFIGRVIFLYHYLPAYGFALIILVFWLRKLWSARPHWVLLFLGLGFLSFMYFLPWSIGWISMTQQQVQEHTWLPNWLAATATY